jgi:putative oxidoreductase
MATPLRHHAEDALSYPSDERIVVVRMDHPAWLAIGRAVFGGYFVWNGIQHFMQAGLLAGYAASKGVPVPELAVLGSGTLILLGGLSLVLGVYPRVGGLLILLFLLGVTPVMHDFWNTIDPAARANAFGNFLKNIGLIGGACFAVAVPEPWPGSLRPAMKARAAA